MWRTARPGPLVVRSQTLVFQHPLAQLPGRSLGHPRISTPLARNRGQLVEKRNLAGRSHQLRRRFRPHLNKKGRFWHPFRYFYPFCLCSKSQTPGL